MTLPLQLHDDADLELNEAAQYYDRESPNLGAVFVDDVDMGFKRIREHPDSGPEVADGVRKMVLAKFPFTIIYAVEADHVRVLAIAHQRKRPFYWQSRTE
ncbi:MAG: type II toxin-antitoxin system RelE/ParE family toxin [Actinomycetota bacterium]|nr:type II toxin-antitoxin system RelE/ParE family toxin [Actinomycetota bacterium]